MHLRQDWVQADVGWHHSRQDCCRRIDLSEPSELSRFRDRSCSLPSAPSKVSKRLGTNLGVQGIELSWSASDDDHWISYYEVHKDGKADRKSRERNFLLRSLRHRLATILTCDLRNHDGGWGWKSQPSCDGAEDRKRTTESTKRWEISLLRNPPSNGPMKKLATMARIGNLLWDKGGYEGRWTGSGLGRIGRIWMQPSAQYDLSRTFTGACGGHREHVRRYPQRSQRGKSGLRLCADHAESEAGLAERWMGGS